jgi:hypothetical protein
VAVWASDMALVSILEVLATGVCTTVGGDVVTSAGELGQAMGIVIVGLGSSSSGGSICRVAHQRSGAGLVWTLTLVVYIVCMLVSMVTLAVGSICMFMSIPTFWSRICRSLHLSGPWLVSQHSRSVILPCSSPSFLPCLNAVFRAFSSSSLLSISKTPSFCSSSLAKCLLFLYPS